MSVEKESTSCELACWNDSTEDDSNGVSFLEGMVPIGEWINESRVLCGADNGMFRRNV